MTDEVRIVREGMRAEMRRAALVIKKQGETSAHAAWRRFVRHGLRIKEDAFSQWMSKSPPLISHGIAGDSLIEAGVAKRDGNLAIVDPIAWRAFCAKTAEKPRMLNIAWDGDTLLEAESDPDDLALWQFIVENSRRDDIQFVSEEATDEEIQAVLARRNSQRSKGTRSVPLPNLDDHINWLPFGSAPSTLYWLYKWSMTKDQLRIAIKTHAQWSIDIKHGFGTIRDVAATRWIYQGPYPEMLKTMFYNLRDQGNERSFRIVMVGLMAKITNNLPPNIDAFEAAMKYVQMKQKEMMTRGLPMTVTVVQLHAWFQASEMRQ